MRQLDLALIMYSDDFSGEFPARRQQPNAWPFAMNLSSKLVLRFCACTGIILAGVGGFFLGTLWPNGRVFMDSDHVPLDYQSPQSTSEIKNAQAALNTLAQQYLIKVKVERRTMLSVSGAGLQAGSHPSTIREAQLIEQIVYGISEFKGTEQELCLVQELLLLFESEKRLDRWLDVYLRALYEHPTEVRINRFVGEAVRISKATRREGELLAAFEYLDRIPFDFSAKDQARACLIPSGLPVELSGKSPLL